LALLLRVAGQLRDTLRLHTLDVGFGAPCLSLAEL